MQFDLLAKDSAQRISLSDGELVLIENWLPDSEADNYFESLQKTISWEQSLIKIAGREIKIPRLNAWYGDSDARYAYSGRQFDPLPWLPALLALRDKAQIELNHWQSSDDKQAQFNSALANLYRNGNDSVAWHADDERELGSKPQIASLSLGESRRFMLKHATKKQLKTTELILNHGSLLLMLGNLQAHWVHCVPKTKHSIGARLNITFRRIYS